MIWIFFASNRDRIRCSRPDTGPAPGLGRPDRPSARTLELVECCTHIQTVRQIVKSNSRMG